MIQSLWYAVRRTEDECGFKQWFASALCFNGESLGNSFIILFQSTIVWLLAANTTHIKTVGKTQDKITSIIGCVVWLGEPLYFVHLCGSHTSIT